MMNRTELIAALEAAPGPSRELDLEIARLVRPDMPPLEDGPFGWRVGVGEFENPGTLYRDKFNQPARADTWTAPHYTESIDAALSFTPEGWSWRVEQEFGRHAHQRAILSCDLDRYAIDAATPTIALCIANLRALEAQDD